MNVKNVYLCNKSASYVAKEFHKPMQALCPDLRPVGLPRKLIHCENDPEAMDVADCDISFMDPDESGVEMSTVFGGYGYHESGWISSLCRV